MLSVVVFQLLPRWFCCFQKKNRIEFLHSTISMLMCRHSIDKFTLEHTMYIPSSALTYKWQPFLEGIIHRSLLCFTKFQEGSWFYFFFRTMTKKPTIFSSSLASWWNETFLTKAELLASTSASSQQRKYEYVHAQKKVTQWKFSSSSSFFLPMKKLSHFFK